MKTKKSSILRDPVCMRRMNRNKAYVKIKYENEFYYLCCPVFQSEFMKDSKKYVDKYKETILKNF